MKKLVLAVVACFALLVAAPGTATAQESRPGSFGIGLGQGTGVAGISGKLHSGDISFQGVLGNWWGGWAHGRHRHRAGIGFSFDVLFNMPVFHDADIVHLAWNLGGGAAIGMHPRWTYQSRIHAQFVAGLEFLFPDVPLDIVLEWRPNIRLVPSHWFGFGFTSAGAHIRFYFD